MATQLFLRGDGASGGGADTHLGTNHAKRNGTASGWETYNLGLTRGAGMSDSFNTPTITGATTGVEVVSLGASLPLQWISPPVAADVTISGTITANIWASESNMSANVAINVIIDIIRANTLTTANSNTIVTIVQSTNAAELAVTTRAANNFTSGMTSGGYTGQTLNRGDRLRIRLVGDDVGTMATGFTFNASWAGTSATADGDSYVTFTETITFESAPGGSVVYLTDTASAVSTASVDREAWTSRGAGVQTDVVNTAAGWTAPIQLTDTAGGTVVDWFTRPLTAFTLTGMAVANLRALESNTAANASLRCQIARVEGDGTSPTVWADWAIAPITTNNGELTTSEVARTCNVSGDDLAITDGQRLRIRVYADDMAITAMATAHTVTLYYAGTSGGASGDTYITFPQTLTEYVSGPTTLYGAVTAPFTFDSAERGIVTMLSSVTDPISWDAVTAGVVSTETGVARISLAAGDTPTSRTEHKIKLRGRVTSGVGTLRAALYEGSTNISGDLETAALSTSLAAYTLSIADVAAANITDYSDLELRVWGFAPSGGSIVFELAQVALELPGGAPAIEGTVSNDLVWTASSAGFATHYGSVTNPITHEVSPSAIVAMRSSLTAPFAFDTASAAYTKRYGASDNPYALGIAVNGVRSRYGIVSTDLVWDATVAGFAKRYGVLANDLVWTAAEAGFAKRYGALAEAWVFGISASGEVAGGVETFYGAATTDLVWTASTNGIRTRYGTIDLPITWTAAEASRVTMRSSVTSPFAWDSATSSKRTTYSAITAPFAWDATLAPRLTARASVTSPYLFDIYVDGTLAGTLKLGAITSPFAWDAATNGIRETYGATATPLTFDTASAGFAKRYGTVTLPLTLEQVVNGFRIRYGTITFPLVWDASSAGSTTGIVTGAITAPFALDIATATRLTARGALAVDLAFDTATLARLKLLAALGVPFALTIDTGGIKVVTGATAAEIIWLASVAGVADVTLLEPIYTGSIGNGSRATIESATAGHVPSGHLELGGTLGAPTHGQIADTVGGTTEEVAA